MLYPGTLDTLILKALSWGPRHGYAVAHWLRQTSGDELQVEDGALYTALHRLEHRGHLKGEWGVNDENRRVKLYQLTPAGRAELGARHLSWNRYVSAVDRVLSAT